MHQIQAVLAKVFIILALILKFESFARWTDWWVIWVLCPYEGPISNLFSCTCNCSGTLFPPVIHGLETCFFFGEIWRFISQIFLWLDSSRLDTWNKEKSAASSLWSKLYTAWEQMSMGACFTLWCNSICWKQGVGICTFPAGIRS